MRLKKCFLILSATLCAFGLRAQVTNQFEQLQRQVQQLQQMQENSDKVQREQRQQIEALSKQVTDLTRQQAAEVETKKLEQQMASELQTNSTGPQANAPLPPPSWSPSQPMTIARAGSAYMNISFDAMMAVGGSTASDPSAFLQLGDHDPQKNGFSLRNAEIALDGAVDPYFKGFANIVLKLDNNNETSIELEEAYAQSTSLPANLQLKAGQFFANFGRQNPQHPHTWAFVDQPIILGRAFGPDGLRSIAAQLSWLVPTPFYTEAFLGIFDGQGGTSFSFRNPGEPDTLGVNRFYGRATMDRTLRNPGDAVFVPRIASSFELTDNQTLVLGASAAFGPNDTGADARTEIYGVDAYWKWKPSDADAGFPFVSWQTELLYRRFDAGADPTAVPVLPAETLNDWGGYSQVLWGFKPRWVTGLRGEYASGNTAANDAGDPFRGERYRVSPVLTFFPSEFSKIRLQYNYDHGEQFGDAHSIWLQVEFMLGAHGAHKF
jgi:TolA-binding protein